MQEVIVYQPRRTKMKMGNWNTAFLHKTEPWVAAWWSAAFPGFGHMLLGMQLKGAVFLIGEIFLNFFGNINIALVYTFTFQWDQAREVINYDFAFFYTSIWVFSILNSYQLAVIMNKNTYLESKQKIRRFEFDIVRGYDINFLEKRTPWVALFWSCVFTGLGNIYCQRILLGFLLLGWTLATAINTHLPLMTLYTFTGQFDQIANVVNYEWLLFFPSTYFFGIYCSYSSVVYQNQLFKEEQMYYFAKKYGRNVLEIV